MDNIFVDLKDFVAEPRFTSLQLSPAASRVVLEKSQLNDKADAYVTSLWEARDGKLKRLTTGLHGERFFGFTKDDEVLFTAKRDTEAESKEQKLFILPKSGEARLLTTRPYGFSNFSLASVSADIAFTSPVFATAESDSEDAQIAKERSERKLSGILHRGYPVRYWDHDLGPGLNQLFILKAAQLESQDPVIAEQITDFSYGVKLNSGILNHDATKYYAELTRLISGTKSHVEIVEIDIASKKVETLVSDPNQNFSLRGFSAEGDYLVLTSNEMVSREKSLAFKIHLFELATGSLRTLSPYSEEGEFSDWPDDFQISADAKRIYFSADFRGRGAIYELEVESEKITRLTTGKYHYTNLHLDKAAEELYALADAIDQPPLPVKLDPKNSAAELEFIETDLRMPQIPGELTEISTKAEDGTEIRSWLCLPKDASKDHPVPLLLWIHGGPFSSWNAWTWRWNPWTAVARGMAVLLPDPAISTGYSQQMIDRGWSELGGAPFKDLMAITEAALELEQIDQNRRAALGGSYGGYMANWIAGQTGDYFNCIVTHASLWNLDQFRHTTDTSVHWGAHISDSHVAEFNPAAHVDKITAPMLVIHGDKDYRVPIGEGLRLWYELLSAANLSAEQNPHRFLYFPDENHWILSPNNSITWYETVFAFLDTHLNQKPEKYPKYLG